MIEVFLRASNLYWVEVEQVVLLLEDFREALSVHSLMQNLVLDPPCKLYLLLILGLHLGGLVLNLADLVIKDQDCILGLLLLLNDGCSDIALLLPFLFDHPVKLLNLLLVVFILHVCLLHDIVLLLYVVYEVLILLLVDSFC